MLSPYLKAIYGAIYAGFIAADIALADGHVTWQEGVKVAIAAVGGLGIIWAVPNTKKTDKGV